MLKQALTSDNTSVARNVALFFAHARDEIRTEELVKLCQQNVDAVFTAHMRNPYEQGASFGLPLHPGQIQPAINNVFDTLNANGKPGPGDTIPLQRIVAAFVVEQRRKTTSCAITPPDLNVMEKILKAAGETISGDVQGHAGVS